MTQLAENIRTLMQKKGWNAKTLAEKSAQKGSVVYNILNGRSKKPSADKLDAIARALGVSSSYLLYGEEEAVRHLAPDLDGILFADIIHLVRDICKEEGITFKGRAEENATVTRIAQRAYAYATKRGDTSPDRFFIEDLLMHEG